MSKVGIDLKKLAEDLAARGASWNAGETSMTKLSLEEARKRLGVTPPPGAPSIEEIDAQVRQGTLPKDAFVAAAAVGAPAAHDWRNVGGKSYVSAIRNQGGCGSCVSFGTAGVLETTLRVARSEPDLDVDLSEAQLFYCYGRSHGATCSTGWSPDEALDDCAANGLDSRAATPTPPAIRTARTSIPIGRIGTSRCPVSRSSPAQRSRSGSPRADR
jgi:C1A family cysteine protease